MPFILKINTDGEKFKERFDTRRDAIDRANAVMDAGTIVKGTKRAAAASYTPHKLSITRIPKGVVVWQRFPDTYEIGEFDEVVTIKHIWDGVEEDRLLKIQDDMRYEEKRLWRVKEGLE